MVLWWESVATNGEATQSWTGSTDVLGGRLIAAGLLAWMAWIHLHLWSYGYKHVSVVGPLFLANFVAGVALALAVLAAPRRLLAPAALSGMLIAGGTLAGLAISINIGLFGFKDYFNSPFVHLSIWVECAAVVVLGALAFRAGVLRWRPSMIRPERPPGEEPL
jgi:hypothetical protein